MTCAAWTGPCRGRGGPVTGDRSLRWVPAGAPDRSQGRRAAAPRDHASAERDITHLTVRMPGPSYTLWYAAGARAFGAAYAHRAIAASDSNHCAGILRLLAAMAERGGCLRLPGLVRLACAADLADRTVLSKALCGRHRGRRAGIDRGRRGNAAGITDHVLLLGRLLCCRGRSDAGAEPAAPDR